MDKCHDENIIKTKENKKSEDTSECNQNINKNIIKFVIRDSDIGFQINKSPVPTSVECLNMQSIIGMTNIIHYGSQVEPSIAVNPECPSKIVAAWQQDRINNGGSLEIGIAYSNNFGKSWKQTVVPLQLCIGGIIQRTSDVWLSYSKNGTKVYLNVLATNINLIQSVNVQSGIVVSISRDNGAKWSIPKYLITSQNYLNEPTGLFPFDDKNSLTANMNNSKFAYSVWDRFYQSKSFHSDTFFTKTIDGGKTWFPAVSIYDGTHDLLVTGLSNGIYNDNNTLANEIIVLPKNNCDNEPHFENLINFFVRVYAKPTATDDQFINDMFPFKFTSQDIVLIRSGDNGVTWTRSAIIIAPLPINNYVFPGGYTYDLDGNITGGIGPLLRTGASIPYYAINPKNGNLYVVFQTPQFRSDQLSQIALTVSRDGGLTWSIPIMVNRTPQNLINSQAFTASVAVNEDGYVAIMYNDFRNDNKIDPINKTLTDVWLAIYKERNCDSNNFTEASLTFIKEIRLSKQSYIIQNGPTTTQGIMTNGDYSSIVACKKFFYMIYTKAFCGPFSPPIILINDPNTDTILELDKNRRTDPFVSIIKID